MITKDNLREVLESLGFENKNENYVKKIDNYTLEINYKNQIITYPKEIKIHDKTTSNFAHPENFVVFECVHRLLEKGYKAESLELEPKWQLGRETKSGKADILVRDNQNAPYLIIECKTAGSEFSKEWGKMQNDGGQLFSYFQQEKSVKYLCLYTSDLENESKSIKYQNYIINMQDNEVTLAQSKKQGYKDANSNKEVFQIWSDTYAKEYEKNGIFEDEIAVYNITKLKPNLDNLKPMSQSEIQKKRHEWAIILRANAVGDRSLALNGLMNLLLCKITDELENANDLQFSWRGYSRDSAFDLVDRLQKLYKIGMEKYLNQTITYHSKDSIEEAFTSAFEGIVVKEKIQNIFNELKYFSNGDFNFIEVYNENLFYKNFKILLPIVLKLEDIAFTKNADSNILGDYFESYIHDMPQQEGQYFTPVPLVNFIIHSLPVFKNASVLDFSCGAGHFLTQYAEINKPYKKAKFLGQDKDPRLAKIAKIASFMHSTDMDILANDSLECGIDDSKFNVLISNPPYSVDGFLNVLSDDIRKSYELFNDKLNIESNDTIQCFFIEKASKALQDNGLLSLVLPNTILENDKGVPLNRPTREILLRDFCIIAICELGSATFFKTNTSPIVLFALRKAKNTNTKTTQNDIYKDFYKHIVENKLSTILLAYESEFLALLQAYCTFRAYDKDEFLELLELNLQEDSTLYTNELFKEYVNAYKALIQKEKDEYNKKGDKYKAQNPFTPSQSKQEFIRKLEAEKFLYFCYCLDSNPLIIKAPSDTKEQKKFLGYFWSSIKGKEGIQYITASGINAISEILTPLYNPKNRFDSSKISFYIMQEYLNKLDSKFLDNQFKKDIAKEQETQQELESYIKQKRLIDMLDFDEVDFRKRIKPTQNAKIISLWKSDIEQITLAECGEFIGGLWTGKKPPFVKVKVIRNTNFSLKGTLKLDSEYPELEVEKSQFEKRKLEYGDIIIEKSGGSSTQAVGRVVIFTFKTNEPYSFSNFTTRLRVTRDDINPFFLHLVLHYIYQQGTTFAMQGGMSGIRNLDMNLYKRLKIPLPPLEIQKQIVAECEKVEEQYNTIRMSIEKYQELIRAILVQCGICDTGGGRSDFSFILETLEGLEAKLDFTLLAPLSQELETNPTPSLRGEAEANHTLDYHEFDKSNSRNDDLNILLNSLPTPPKHGWDRIKLSNQRYLSLNPSKKEMANFDENMLVSFVEMASVSDKGYIQTKTDKALKELRKGSYTYFAENDILIAKITPCMENGKCGIATKLTNGVGMGSSEFHIFRARQDVLLNKFLFLCLNQDSVRQEAASNMTGVSGHRRVPISFYESLQIPLPPLEAQEKIVQAIEAVEVKIANIDSSLAKLETRKAEILNNALNAGNERERERTSRA